MNSYLPIEPRSIQLYRRLSAFRWECFAGVVALLVGCATPNVSTKGNLQPDQQDSLGELH